MSVPSLWRCLTESTPTLQLDEKIRHARKASKSTKGLCRPAVDVNKIRSSTVRTLCSRIEKWDHDPPAVSTTNLISTSQNWDYLIFGYYLVPSITCHHCLYCTWYDACLLYTSPITHNTESQAHLRQHTALVVCETELRPHTNATAAAAPPPSKPPKAHHTSTTTATLRQHSSKDSSRGGGGLTSPATVCVPDFKNQGKRRNKSYRFKI